MLPGSGACAGGFDKGWAYTASLTPRLHAAKREECMQLFDPVPGLVRESDAESVRTLTLDNSATRNALSGAMMASLETALVRAGDEPAVRVIVLAANGAAICAGHA